MRNSIVKAHWMLHCLISFTVLVPLRAAVFEADYAYDQAGRLLGVQYGDGTTITYLYDDAGHILRKDVSSFVDSDGNGIDDQWEIDHFGETDIAPNADPDGDGMSNIAEFMAGTGPEDPTDFLDITELEAPSGPAAVEIQWTAVPGKTYRVQYSNTLLPHDWHDLPGDVLAQDDIASKLDSSRSNDGRRFYRVLVLQ